MRPNGFKGSAVLMALATGLASAAPLPTWAQAPASGPTAVRPAIRVAPVILAEPEVETSINIQVGPDGSVPRQTFLRVRGLPLAARLSDGHVVTPGIWAVPLASLPSLRLHAPLSSSGRTEIHLALVGVDGGVLAEAKSSLVVAPAWLLGSGSIRQDAARPVPTMRLEPPPAPPTPAAMAQPMRPAAATLAAPEPPRVAVTPPPAVTVAPAALAAAAVPPAPPAPQPATRPDPPQVLAALPPPPSAVAPSAAPLVRPAPPPPAAAAPAPKMPPVLSAADRQRAEALVQRGDVFLRQGNVAAARQFYRRAADIGLASAALKMGATYDPTELAAQSVVGLVGDTKEAGAWYERARELGAPEAGARLSRLQRR